MKPEWKALILVFLLLMVQVISELTLPAYTSTLVNVGVQQSGIPGALADKLSVQSMESLTLLMDEGEKAAISKAYTQAGELYLLKEGLSRQEQDAAQSALTLPMALLFGAQNMPGGELLLPGLRSGQVTRDMLLQRLGEQTPLTGETGQQFLNQAAAQFVRAEYERLGENLDQIRNSYLWDQGMKMLGLTLLSGLAAVFTSFISGRAGARVGRSLRSQVFKKVLSFSKAEIDRFSTASLITRSTNDINQIQTTSVMMLRMILYAPIMAIGGIWRVTQVRTGLGWIVAVTVSVMVVLVVVIASVVTPKFKTLQKLVDRMNLVARENLTGVQVVRAFSREAHETGRYGKANDDLTAVNRFINYAFSYVMPLMMLVINGVVLAILWFGAQGIDAGRMQVGDMIAFISYTMQIAFSFMTMAMAGAIMLPRAEVASQRVREVLDTVSAIRDADNPQPLPTAASGRLEFDRVSFRYPDSQEDVLSGLTFEILPGQTAAVIGATGSGKSSLIQLIPRFFDVTAGVIRMDGTDIRELTLSDLRTQIGFVPQQAQLFSGTIESNIKFADIAMDNASMEYAAALAQAGRFIAEKDDNYQSEVAQGGSNLSGGQKQRLSIARAIAAKPRFLLFDDSFSALDYRTDLLVRQALREKLSDTTVIIVAQRIATVMQADTILVLDEGLLVGQGTHQELMDSCPAYQQIARSQLSEEELAGKGGKRHE